MPAMIFEAPSGVPVAPAAHREPAGEAAACVRPLATARAGGGATPCNKSVSIL
jgi:hypothetical protein